MSSATTRNNRPLPFASTAAAVYMSKQIDALVGSKHAEGGHVTQRDLALEAGYDKPNVFSMFKRGETKIPIDKISVIAKALRVDPAHLGRLVIQQHWPALMHQFETIFGAGTVSANERKLLELWREHTKNEDPLLNDTRTQKIVKVFSQM